MTTKLLNPKFSFICIMIVAAALLRLVPHLPNFTPVAAMALFGGAYFTKKHFAFLIPIAAMLLSDLIIGFHNYMIAVYTSFVLIVLLGILIQNKVAIKTLIPVSIASSLLFYLITNFAVWYGSPFYTQDIAGLITCYVAAIPFIAYQFLGDIFYVTILFGSYYLITKKYPALA